MDEAISWNQAEGNALADRNPYVGPAAIGEGVFARLLAAIDNFTAVPSTFIDGGDHVVALGRYGGTMKDGGATLDSPFCHVYRFHHDPERMRFLSLRLHSASDEPGSKSNSARQAEIREAERRRGKGGDPHPAPHAQQRSGPALGRHRVRAHDPMVEIGDERRDDEPE